MVRSLRVLFSFVLVAMIAVTAWASLDRSVFEAGNLLRDPWGVATLLDAYFGFLTFYCWVAYKERGWPGRVLWLVAIAALGNIAMASYVLTQLRGMPTGAGAERLLLRRD